MNPTTIIDMIAQEAALPGRTGDNRCAVGVLCCLRLSSLRSGSGGMTLCPWLLREPQDRKSSAGRNVRVPAVLALAFLMVPLTAAAQDWHEGLCQATVDASLSFPVPGVLAKVEKKEGEPVKQGDVILELESETENLEVSRQILAVDAAKKDFERSKSVFAKGGSVSQEDVEQKEAVWKIAIVEQQQAEAQLRRRQLVSPGAGVVVDLFDLDRGEAVAANTPAARVVDISHCRFTVYVRGDSAHGFEKGKAVEIQFRIDREEIRVIGTEETRVTGTEEITVTGTVDFVSPAIDAASGLLEVRAVFDNKDRRVPAGLLGKMRLKSAP
jgi:RND family efflux transporter MFP subunit